MKVVEEIWLRRFSNEKDGFMKYKCYTVNCVLPKSFFCEFKIHVLNDNPEFKDGVAVGVSTQMHQGKTWNANFYSISSAYLSNGNFFSFAWKEELLGEGFESGDVIALRKIDQTLQFFKNGKLQEKMTSKIEETKLYLFLYINAGSDVEILNFTTTEQVISSSGYAM